MKKQLILVTSFMFTLLGLAFVPTALANHPGHSATPSHIEATYKPMCYEWDPNKDCPKEPPPGA